MKGFVNIKVSEHGFGVDCDLDDVSLQNKFELMHSLATALEMDAHEMFMYTRAEQMGVMDEAESVTHCESEEELQAMLDGAHLDDTEEI